ETKNTAREGVRIEGGWRVPNSGCYITFLLIKCQYLRYFRAIDISLVILYDLPDQSWRHQE
ncbi:MAG: hypothetical protein AAB518_04030, partial [Patescibacteria group bacterium]